MVEFSHSLVRGSSVVEDKVELMHRAGVELTGDLREPVHFRGGGPLRLQGAGPGLLWFSHRYAVFSCPKNGTAEIYSFQVLTSLSP